MGADIVKNKRVAGFLEQVRGGVVAAAVEAQVFRADGFEDDDDDILGASDTRRRLEGCPGERGAFRE
jgi:hypothetical protein